MTQRKYYSRRNGSQVSFENIKEIFLAIYTNFANKDYFQEAFGLDCPDGSITGKVGENIKNYFLMKLRKNLWPISSNIIFYSQNDLFDIIELLYDLVSKPIETEGCFHPYMQDYHYVLFDKSTGQNEFREEINQLLIDCDPGYLLSESGEIIKAGDPGLVTLLDSKTPNASDRDITERIHNAIIKFRDRNSTWTNRRDAVRDLADVLEYLKPQVKEQLLTQDEKDLFHIANKFAIRHNDHEQKKDYEQRVWYSWIFYVYLSTIHLILRLSERTKEKK